MTEPDDNDEIRRIFDEWRDKPSPMSEAIEDAILNAPMPNPDGKPSQSEPLPVAYFLAEPSKEAPLEQRLLPAAKVDIDAETGLMGPIRYRADLAQGDEVAYDE